MKKHLSTILLVLIFIIGLAVVLYPTVSDYWNAQVQSRAIVDYESALQNLTQKDYTDLKQAAYDYNAALREVAYPLMYFDTLDEREDLVKYEDLLNVNGNGVMGYITIEKLGVELPVYHGTSPSVLNVAAGHLQGTSLPVGGSGTHCVISAHRGLPSARLFTDLDDMVVGDTFTLTVLDEVLTYEVDQILIVLPNEVDELYVTEGQDYCTLLTCTPYGINTHRLLVRGHRIETVREKPTIYVPADAFVLDSLMLAPLVALPMLLILLVFLLVKYRKKNDRAPGAKGGGNDAQSKSVEGRAGGAGRAADRNGRRGVRSKRRGQHFREDSYRRGSKR